MAYSDDDVAELRDRVKTIAKRTFRALDPEDLDNLPLCALSLGLLALQMLRVHNTPEAKMRSYLRMLEFEMERLSEWDDLADLHDMVRQAKLAPSSDAVH